MHDYKHLKSKDSFFSEHPLFEWNLSNYIKYYEKKYSQKSKKALESTFLYHLKSIARDPSISEELKDAVDDIVKESENKDKVQVESSNCIKINGNVTSSNINLVASSSNIAVERQTIEKAIEERQITEKVIEERQKLRDEVGDLFNPLPTGNAANKRKIDQTEILYDSVNRPIILASQVRHELHGSLSQIEIATLKKMAKNLKPTTMAEELDLMSAQLILDLNDGDINEVNALKLSLSKTVSFVNFSTLKVFQKYIKNESFWEEVNSVNIELAPAMSVTSEETFNRIIQLSKDAKDRLALKQLRLAIAKEKVKAIEENEDDITAVLDIMEITARNIIADDTLKPNENDSEMTCYRKVASILDILLKDLNLNLLE
ncbi:hypothetical protein INT46_005940 [Mucor plumbeus]|uniref:Uncharacterized protein n=1 Tax=Mucor plumbeus TaxID=97098 RepID=A0A8H7RT53_9FUNG|nr:hypothetical protein INT46_005940 [Mucor plumbeus]